MRVNYTVGCVCLGVGLLALLGGCPSGLESVLTSVASTALSELSNPTDSSDSTELYSLLGEPVSNEESESTSEDASETESEVVQTPSTSSGTTFTGTTADQSVAQETDPVVGLVLDLNLVGSWLHEDAYSDEGVDSSSNALVAMLNANGSFVIMTQATLSGGAADSDAMTGTWEAANGELTLLHDDGAREEYSYYIEYTATDRLMLVTDTAGGQATWMYQG